jgi:hypothetical protein
MQHSLPILPIARYSCSLAFTTISGDYSVVIVHGDLSAWVSDPFTHFPSGQLGSIDLHALPTHIPLSSPLIAVLNPDLQSGWVTPSATGVVYNDPINPPLAAFNNMVNNLFNTPLQLPELGGGIGFRISSEARKIYRPEHCHWHSYEPSRLYRVRAQVFLSMTVHQPFSPGNSPHYHSSRCE